MKKVAVITGGSSGIGLQTAKLLKEKNYDVVILANNIEKENTNNYKCDVSNEEQVKAVFEQIGKKYNQIDVLINSAGFGISGASELIEASQINNLYNVNVMGIVHTSQQALKYMKPGAKIINLGSAMAFFPLPFRTMYASSKAAVVTLSYGMKMELEEYGVGVCVVCPGDVKTNFTKNRVKNFVTNEKYGQRIERAANELDGKEDKRMEPIVVAKQIVKQLESKNMKRMIIVGTKYRVLYVLQKLLPTSWVHKVIAKNFNGYEK